MRKTVEVKLKRATDNSYPIVFSPNILHHLGKLLAESHKASSYVIICDETVKKLFGGVLRKQMLHLDARSLILSIPAGEQSKKASVKNFLEESMFRAGCDRRTLIIALGGGVVGDLAGFVAATYMRGIDYIQVPTTLLAMVDSSIGGKTGINNSFGKNLVGAFWQPKAVYVDFNFLQTLPLNHFKNGLFEVIKIFTTSDTESFKFFQKNVKSILKKNPKVLEKIIARAVELKASVVGNDERESSERMILNFGHTISHAIEKLSGYSILHGYAVALGMLVEGQIAVNAGILSKADFETLKKVILDLGVNTNAIKKYKIKDIIRVTRGDKKSSDGRAKYVLLKKIGGIEVKQHAYAHSISEAEVRKALHDIIALYNN